jgi:hypothetical protein
MFNACLPNGLHGASTLAQIGGADYIEAGDGVSAANPPAAVLDPGAAAYSYTLYSYDAPTDSRAVGLAYNLSNVDTECWLGLANYHLHKWEWRQISATGGTGSVQFSNPLYYIAMDGNVYWVIVASHGHSVQVDSFDVDYQSSVKPMFYVPPAGQQTISDMGMSPQTVLMPPLPSTGNQVAPVVVYTKTWDSNTELNVGYYNGTEWKHTGFYGGRSYTLPQARWHGDEGVVVAYDATNSQLDDIRVDQWWEIDHDTTIPLPAGLSVPTLLSMDINPATGYAAVAYALAGDPARVYTNFEDETGWQEPVLVGEYPGESIPGLSFKFDPAGGAPWLVFTHGVAQYDATMTVDYSMEFGRYNAGAWELTDSGRPNSPMTVELGFDGNTPKLVFSEVRQGTVSVQVLFWTYDIDVPLLVDGYVGTYDGANWNYARFYESTISNSFNLGTMVLTLNLNMAPACGWAKTNELYYNHVVGSVDFKVEINGSSPTVTPQGGTLTNSVAYMIDGGSGYAASNYFDGAPGMGFSWAERDTARACAYVAKESVTVDDITSGKLFTENTLYYWTPEE